MTAMDNASKNAGEMIRKLTLQYNRVRQAGITKELLEIIGGKESAEIGEPHGKACRIRNSQASHWPCD